MRTDSVNLSDTALQAAQAEITQLFGASYHQRRQYKNKTANAQEAHEAIRPTNFAARQVSSDAQEQKLYDLIWKRTVASQMAEAQLEKTLVDILITPVQPVASLPKFEAVGEIIVFDGFLKLYIEGQDDDNEDDDSRLLPQLNVGEAVTNRRITATERFTHHPPRYTEASLVKKMEELGIGRPSTYAPTISTIQKREYVVKESREGTDRPYTVLTLEKNQIHEQKKTEKAGAEKNKLFPTDLGFIVTDFLVEYFTDIVDYKFTATVEESFDLISRGQLGWQQMLTDFYQPFHQRVELTAQAAERKAGDRHLGDDPQTGKPVIARLGRYGPLIQLGTAEDPDKRYVSLQPNQRIETITLAEALTLFQLPRTIGEVDGLVVKANNGKFGPYIQHNGKFYSLPKEANLYTLNLEQAVAIMQAKQQADRDKVLKSFPENANFQILNGRFGPYLLAEGHNVKLPKGSEPASLTLADCEKLLEGHLQSPTYLKKLAAQKAKLLPKRESIIRRFPGSDWLIAVDRFGLYLFVDGDKLRLPKDREAESFTLEELTDLWAKHAAKLKKKKADTADSTGKGGAKNAGTRGNTGGSQGRRK
jgi:DNA topoisomerase-1